MSQRASASKQGRNGTLLLAGLRSGWVAQTLGGLKKKPAGMISLIVLLVMVALTAGAPLIAPYAVDESTGRFAEGPSFSNWFGTDHLGRDVLSRVIWGGRVSLQVGLLSVILGIGSGSALGVVSGYFGGWIDTIVQRVVDVFMSIPTILLALTIIAAFGAGVFNVTMAIALAIAPRAARVARASTLAVKQQPYVEAAESLGARSERIVLRHLLPNIAAPIIVIASVQLGVAIIVEASLSFLGLGVPINVPTWGNMLSGAGLTYMTRAPWMAIFPGLALTLTVLAVNLLGDALRDVLDPRLRGSTRGV